MAFWELILDQRDIQDRSREKTQLEAVEDVKKSWHGDGMLPPDTVYLQMQQWGVCFSSVYPLPCIGMNIFNVHVTESLLTCVTTCNTYRIFPAR